MNLSERLVHLRKQSHFTLKYLANYLGVSITAYQKYERGVSDVSNEKLNKLADLYGVSTDYLLGRDNAEPDTLEQFVKDYDMSDVEEAILKRYSLLPKSSREEFVNFLKASISDADSTNYDNQPIVDSSESLKLHLFGTIDVPDEKLEEVISYASYVKNKSDDNQDG